MHSFLASVAVPAPFTLAPGARALAVCAVAMALVVPASAEARVERPIVYAVVIDGLDGDRVDQGKAPFISSLLRGAGAASTYYRESRSVLIAETNPNHVAMMTGAYADRSGVPGNGYGIYAPVKEDSCERTGPFDESKPPTRTSGEHSSCILAQTVFESVKRQGNPDGILTAAFLGKPKLGTIFAGRRFDDRSLDVDHLWTTCSRSLEGDEDYCDRGAPKNEATEYALTDEIVMDAVIRSIEEGIPAGGGTRRRPDFTLVNLPQVDAAGHGFGVGPMYDLAIALADDEIERLVGELRRRGEWERTVLILLSDHAMDTAARKTSVTATIVDGGVASEDFNVLGSGSGALVYLTNRKRADRHQLLRRIRAAALANPDVDEALYRQPNPADGGEARTVDEVHPGWHMAGTRTGDLIVTHVPGGAFTDPVESSNPLSGFAPRLVGQHGAPQTRDNFFAVIGGGPHVRQALLSGLVGMRFDDTLLNPRQSENVDVAPTVMGLLGLFPTRDNAGRFLHEAFDLARLPGGGRPAGRPRLRVRRLTRRRCARRVRYRLRWAPTGGRYDLRVRRRGRGTRRVLRDSPRSSYVLRARAGRRYRVRLRMRSAAGSLSGLTTRKLRPRRPHRCR